MSRLDVKGLTYAVAGRTLVQEASFRLEPGKLVALLGPNGAGKTSLLRLALGLLPAASGTSEIDGSDIRRMSASDRARSIAYLPQTRPLAWPTRVRDVVALGRFAHGGPLGRLHGEDAAAVERALTACDLAHLADRNVDTLSGGELARVHLARALATEAPLIIADEPAAALDPLHQHQVMALLKQAAERGGGVLVVLHDLALAARYADRLIWMLDGQIVVDGAVRETLTTERIASVYGVRAHVDDSVVPLQVTIEGAL
jgi:iron complex transport system ATP-binding protein